MDGLLGGLLGYLKDPRRTQQVQGIGNAIEQGLLRLQESDKRFKELADRAFDPKNPGRIKDKEALKELTDMTMTGLLGFAPAGLTVFHGSPASFKRFDPTKIGTGEGAQAYGYGHYVAQSPDVAKGYQSATSKDRFITKDGYFEPAQLEHLNVRAALRKGNLDEAIEIAKKYGVPDSDYPETAAKAARDLAKLQALKESGGIQQNTGAFYKIDLPDEQIAKMLDWDKPLSEQPFKIQSSVFNEMTDSGYSKDEINYLLNNKSGMELYKKIYKDMEQGVPEAINMAKRMNLGETGLMMDAPALASESLRRMGIPGIRYLDQGSRGAGQGTSNFVVFPGNEDLLRILERNNTPIGLLD